MAGGREIRKKIKSVRSTQKITSAMEMVATSKMRKAQERMLAARPYADKIRGVIVHMGRANLEYRHPYCEARPVKRVGLILISTDRGLCGALNANEFRMIVSTLRDGDAQGIETDLCTIGAKGTRFFRRIGANIVAQVPHIGDNPRVEDLIGVMTVMLDAFENRQIDQLFLIYNRFIKTMTQQPHMQQLLPCPMKEISDEAEGEMYQHWDYLYEPEAQGVLDYVLRRYIESLVYRAAVENVACEQAARMIAMKNATENAGDLIEELQLAYNKARQASITRELSEIVAGAAAI
jgi:F-type H+-transporting ATPase subunit gamma